MDRYINKCNLKSTNKSCIYNQLSFGKVTKERESSLFNKLCWDKGRATCTAMKPDSSFTSYSKVDTK